MATKQDAITAMARVLTESHTDLKHRVFVDPWDFGRNATFDISNMETGEPFAVVGVNHTVRSKYSAYGGFEKSSVENTWSMKTFVGLAPGVLEIDTSVWYEMCGKAHEWEARVRAVVEDNSDLKDDSGVPTVRQLGFSGQPFLEIINPVKWLYYGRWWWGIMAYTGVIQEI